MGTRRGRPALPEGEQRTKSWRRMITPEEWAAAQAFLSHHGRSQADVIWNGPPLAEIVAEGRELLEKRRKRTKG